MSIIPIKGCCRFAALFSLIFFCNLAIAQKSGKNQLQESDSIPTTTDTLLNEKKEHSPTKASLMSAALPGLGQVYNKKYWKVPVVYAALGTAIYFAVDMNGRYQNWKQAYIYRIDEDPATEMEYIGDQYLGNFSSSFLLQQTELYRRNRDLIFVGTGVIYFLNIIDAAVDAHLYNFNVSDDLSLEIKPDFKYSPNTNTLAQGIRIRLNW